MRRPSGRATRAAGSPDLRRKGGLRRTTVKVVGTQRKKGRTLGYRPAFLFALTALRSLVKDKVLPLFLRRLFLFLAESILNLVLLDTRLGLAALVQVLLFGAIAKHTRMQIGLRLFGVWFCHRRLLICPSQQQ